MLCSRRAVGVPAGTPTKEGKRMRRHHEELAAAPFLIGAAIWLWRLTHAPRPKR